MEGANAQAHKVLLRYSIPSPTLSFDLYATALRDIIENRPGCHRRPGRPGLRQDRVDAGHRVQTLPGTKQAVPFSAWRYEKEEHLILPLLDAGREALVRWVRSAANPNWPSGEADVRARRSDENSRWIGEP